MAYYFCSFVHTFYVLFLDFFTDVNSLDSVPRGLNKQPLQNNISNKTTHKSPEKFWKNCKQISRNNKPKTIIQKKNRFNVYKGDEK